MGVLAAGMMGTCAAQHSSSHSGQSSAPAHGQQSGPMQGGAAPANARDPDYSDGLSRAQAQGETVADAQWFGAVVLDKLEYADARSEDALRLDGWAWYGGDYNKLFLKADGARAGGRLSETRTEALWDRVFATYWSTQIGIRQDVGGEGPNRTWVAAGIQGLAPYWFDVEATFYVGEEGRTALRLEAQYDVLLTQRLILRASAEAAFYGRSDARRGIGNGLSELEYGLRLRYEIRRQFAPYLGVAWRQRLGNTADIARVTNEPVSTTQLLAGVRIWF